MNHLQKNPPRMNTNTHERTQNKILFKDESYEIVGCALHVLNTLGHGFLEKVYEKALVVALKKKNIPYKQQAQYNVMYENESVGCYIPDLIVYDRIIIELKTIKNITDQERSQMLNYLKATDLKLGLILNFAKPKLEWERIVL